MITVQMKDDANNENITKCISTTWEAIAFWT